MGKAKIMVKLRKIAVPVPGVDCPDCGAHVIQQVNDGAFFYECDCGVQSYRYLNKDHAERDFENRFHGKKRKGIV